MGLNAALHLLARKPRLKVLVIERGFLPTGASTRNAGFACFGSPSELLDDLSRHDEDTVFGLVHRRYEGLKRLRKNLGDRNIGYERSGSFEVFSDTGSYEQCIGRLEYLNIMARRSTGIKNVYRRADGKIKQFGLGNVRHLLENTAEGMIDTGKMMRALMQKVQLAGAMIVNALELKKFSDAGNTVEIETDKGFSFASKRLLICNNGFARELLPELDVVPARAQVLITAPVKGLKLRGAFHFEKGFYYFRNVGSRVLLGGGRNLDFKGEETSAFGITEQIQSRLEQLLHEMVIPGKDFSIEQRWSGIMGVGPQKITIIQPVSKNVFCAVRMGGMGVAIGSLVGEDAARLVLKSL